jgi:energy-converting hydrogenase A subunit M
MPSILERHLNIKTLHDKPVVQQEKPKIIPQKPIEEIASQWIVDFNEAIKTENSEAVAGLFQEDGIPLYKAY